jgi:hypothetical protein
MLFVLLLSATGAIWRSALVAALFAVHPLNVESVAWLTERRDVMSTLLLFAAIASYIRCAKARGGGFTPARLRRDQTKRMIHEEHQEHEEHEEVSADDYWTVIVASGTSQYCYAPQAPFSSSCPSCSSCSSCFAFFLVRLVRSVRLVIHACLLKTNQSAPN